MSSGTYSGGGGEKKGEEKATSENVPVVGTSTLTSSHAHILPSQQAVMDLKNLPSLRPKMNQPVTAGTAHQGPGLSTILPSGIVTTPSDGHGHITATPSTVGLPVTIPQNIVHLGGAGPTSQPLSGSLPLNVMRGGVAPRPQFPSHLPRGAIAAASALSKTGPNIATAAATAVVRPPVPIPVSSSAIHGTGALPTLQNTLGRSPKLSARNQGTPPSTRSPSPAVSISASPQQPVSVDAHRSAYQLHAPATPTTTQNIQITLTTTRSTTAIEIPKPVNTQGHQKPVNIPLTMTPQSKVIVSQQVNPHIHPTQLKSVNITSHTTPSSTPVTLSSISTVTAAASTSSTIPIAKVTPQRQQQSISQSSTIAQSGAVQDLSRVETSSSAPVATHPHSQTASSIFIPQPHRTTTTTAPLNTAISVPTSAPQQESRLDSRSVGNIPQLPHFISQQDPLAWNNYSIPYPQLVYQQVAAAQAAQTQNPLTAAATTPVRPSGLSTLIFPRPQVDQSVPGQNPNLAATLQAHAMTMTPAHTVRLAANSMMVQVDPRHPMSAVHTQFAPTASSVSSGVSLPLQDTKPVISSSTLNVCRTPPPATHDGGHNMSLSSGATVASSIYTSSPNMQQPVSSAGSTNNPGASPRPSILRKRTSEGVGVVVKRPLGLMPDSQSPKPEPPQPQSNTSSPKTPAGDNNSQSSTDTALSSNDATTPTQNSHGDVRIKQEPPDSLENGPSLLNSLASSPLNNSVEASPRKKPRKQLLNATEELKDNTSTDEEVEKVSYKENKSKEIKREQREEYVDEDGVRWTSEKKRPNINLLNFYNITWKPKNNHFQRFADVKPKEERRPTVNELSNQRGIYQRASGWKLYHMASQLENLTDLEKDMCTRISQLQAALAPRTQTKQTMVEDYNGILHELSQANIQRCQLISDQLEEARSSMLKILEHKPRIQEIINKHMSKRPIKKKERT